MTGTKHATRQITWQPHGHLLANRNCWTADGQGLLYDVRDEETQFTGKRIERVDIGSGEVRNLYTSPGDAYCGVPTCSPIDDRFVFIHSCENHTEDWQYCAWHRRGVISRLSQPQVGVDLDARNIMPPFTPGALRGGTHLHTFSPNGSMIASTYEDHVLATTSREGAQSNRRMIAISLLGHSVKVPKSHLRNHDGNSFSFVATKVEEQPKPGTDEIFRAYSESWINDYQLAFQGDVCGRSGKMHTELFIFTLPKDSLTPEKLINDNHAPLVGTATTRPGVPLGISMRRLTYTDEEPSPGLASPRHWAVASPDGNWLGGFRTDEQNWSQFTVVNSSSGEQRRISSHPFSAMSAFTWHPNGMSVAYVADGSVFQVFIDGREPVRLTDKMTEPFGPTHHACVFSPDGSNIAFLRPVPSLTGTHVQIFLVDAID